MRKFSCPGLCQCMQSFRAKLVSVSTVDWVAVEDLKLSHQNEYICVHSRNDFAPYSTVSSVP